MFELDHVALQTNDINESVAWYVANLGAVVLYADDSWAFMKIGQGKLALVKPEQHPAHVALRVNRADLDAAAMRYNQPIATHRDGTAGIYIEDPEGHALELICYPETAEAAPEY